MVAQNGVFELVEEYDCTNVEVVKVVLRDWLHLRELIDIPLHVQSTCGCRSLVGDTMPLVSIVYKQPFPLVRDLDLSFL